MAGRKKLYHWDGRKASLLWDEATDAWTYYTNEPASDVQEYYKAVPTIFRGVTKIAQGVAEVPFAFYQGDNEVDVSNNYQNKIGFLPSPQSAFAITSQSLDLTGKAYFLKNRNDADITKQLQYMKPTSITPKFNERTGELEKFIRQLNQGQMPLDIEEVIYYWLPDPYVETGPPTAYPVKTALAAAGLLKSLDEFATLYFDRGAVSPLIVSVSGNPPPEERDRLQEFFTRLMGGIKNAFTWRVFQADTIEVQEVGSGLSELRDVELTRQKREDIAIALGIPSNILFDEAVNYATAKQDKFNFFDETVVPRCSFIAETLNEQLFGELGYKLVFKPNEMDIFQEDENERSEAWSRYVQGGIPVLMACDLLGVDLTDEQRLELEEREEEKKENREQMSQMREQAVNSPPPPPNAQLDNKAKTELNKWRRKAMGAFNNNKALPLDFECFFVPEDVQELVVLRLQSCKNADDVKNAFNVNGDYNYAEMIGEVRGMIEELKYSSPWIGYP